MRIRTRWATAGRKAFPCSDAPLRKRPRRSSEVENAGGHGRENADAEGRVRHDELGAYRLEVVVPADRATARLQCFLLVVARDRRTLRTRRHRPPLRPPRRKSERESAIALDRSERLAFERLRPAAPANRPCFDEVGGNDPVLLTFENEDSRRMGSKLEYSNRKA